MIWREVEEKYGKKLADRMAKSSYLRCITLEESAEHPGETDIPEGDILLAYRSVTGQKIHPEEWD